MDWGVQHIVTPQGDVLVVMPLAHYQRMTAATAAADPFMLVTTPNNAHAERPTLSDGGPVAPREPSAPREVAEAIDGGETPLAAWRRFRGISQTMLAKKAGVSRFTIMRMEASGQGAGNRQSRQLLAAALDVPMAAL